MPRLVRKLRERTGLPREQFPAGPGVTSPTINRGENGRAKPTPLALKQIKGLLRDMGERGQDPLQEIFTRKEN